MNLYLTGRLTRDLFVRVCKGWWNSMISSGRCLATTNDYATTYLFVLSLVAIRRLAFISRLPFFGRRRRSISCLPPMREAAYGVGEVKRIGASKDCASRFTESKLCRPRFGTHSTRLNASSRVGTLAFPIPWSAKRYRHPHTAIGRRMPLAPPTSCPAGAGTYSSSPTASCVI